MNLKNSNSRFLALFLLAGFAVFGFAQTEAEAQTSRRTKTGKPRVIAQPTPPPPVTAEIISRDADYIQQNQIIEPAETPENQTATPAENSPDSEAVIKELKEKIATLEAGNRNNSDAKQSRLLLNLDILTRAEQRAETLRKQMFEMIEKESLISTKLDQINADIRPEMIERQVAFAGSLRPEELRDMRRKNLEIEKRNLQTLLTDIRTVRANLELNVQKADLLVQKLREKLEVEIEKSLEDEPQN